MRLERVVCDSCLLLLFVENGTNGVFTVSPLSLLKNPMILLGVVALGITFGMPYLIDNSTFSSSFSLRDHSKHTNRLNVQWIPNHVPNSKNSLASRRSSV